MSAQRIVARRVIALAGSDRLPGFLDQPASRGFAVFDAYDGRAGAVPDVFDPAAFARHEGRPPRPGEVGCAVSHWLLLRAFAEELGSDDDLLLVAEDDARLVPEAEAVLGAIAAGRLRTEFVHLADLRWLLMAHPPGVRGDRAVQMSWLRRPLPGGRRIGRYRGEPWGSALYLIARGAARRYVAFVQASGGLAWVADDYRHWGAGAGIDMLLVWPTLAHVEGESTIRQAGEPERQMRPAPPTARTGLRETIALRTRLAVLSGEARATEQDLRTRLAARASRR